MYAVDYSNYLQHHGILGMKWGVRRYQNADGSLTSAGRKRYYLNEYNNFSNSADKYAKKYNASKEGKAKLKEANKAAKRALDWEQKSEGLDFDWNGRQGKAAYKALDKANKLHGDYSRSRNKYVVDNLLKQYGSEKFSIMVSGKYSYDVNKINDSKTATTIFNERYKEGNGNSNVSRKEIADRVKSPLRRGAEMARDILLMSGAVALVGGTVVGGYLNKLKK